MVSSRSLKFNTELVKYNYDTTRFKFVQIIKRIFGDWTESIEDIHHFVPGSDNLRQITIDVDTYTKFHNHYYKSELYSDMLDMYQAFVKECVLPLFDCDDTEFVVQKEPSFRVHLPNNTALGFRPNMGDPEDKIGIHCDRDYGHPDTEINFMLTFGDQFGNNSCFVETSPRSDTFVPIEMKYGEFVSFYGNQCRHYNHKNDTGISRMSIDFRVMPMSNYNPDCNTHSLHSKRKFIIGDYYMKMTR
jgi:hypothetical protein